MSGFDLGSFGNSRTNEGISKTLERELDGINRMVKEIGSKYNSEKKTEISSSFNDDFFASRPTTKWPPYDTDSDKFLTDFNKRWDELREEQTSTFQRYYSITDIIVITAFSVGILIVLILIVFGSTCRKNRTQSGRVLSTGRVLGPGAVQQNQQIPLMAPGQGGPVPQTGRVYGQGAVQQNQQPLWSPGQGGGVPSNTGMPYSNKPLNEEPPSYRNESGKDNVKYVNEQSYHK